MVVVDRSRHVALGREVDDDVRLLDERVHERSVAHVAVPELETSVGRTLVEANRQLLDTSCVGEHVENADPVVGILVVEVTDEITPDETGAAGDEKGLHRNGGASSPQLRRRSIADRYGTHSPCCCG